VRNLTSPQPFRSKILEGSAGFSPAEKLRIRSFINYNTKSEIPERNKGMSKTEKIIIKQEMWISLPGAKKQAAGNSCACSNFEI